MKNQVTKMTWDYKMAFSMGSDEVYMMILRGALTFIPNEGQGMHAWCLW